MLNGTRQNGPASPRSLRMISDFTMLASCWAVVSGAVSVLGFRVMVNRPLVTEELKGSKAQELKDAGVQGGATKS